MNYDAVLGRLAHHLGEGLADREDMVYGSYPQGLAQSLFNTAWNSGKVMQSGLWVHGSFCNDGSREPDWYLQFCEYRLGSRRIGCFKCERVLSYWERNPIEYFAFDLTNFSQYDDPDYGDLTIDDVI